MKLLYVLYTFLFEENGRVYVLVTVADLGGRRKQSLPPPLPQGVHHLPTLKVFRRYCFQHPFFGDPKRIWRSYILVLKVILKTRYFWFKICQTSLNCYLCFTCFYLPFSPCLFDIHFISKLLMCLAHLKKVLYLWPLYKELWWFGICDFSQFGTTNARKISS